MDSQKWLQVLSQLFQTKTFNQEYPLSTCDCIKFCYFGYLGDSTLTPDRLM
jgi:hypothetical protein